jgi:cytochrome c556
LALRPVDAGCAVMRKLLHALYGLLKNRQPFDSAKFYHALATS